MPRKHFIIFLKKVKLTMSSCFFLGMAYGMLTTLPPIYGLYTSLIPAIIYMCTGTSRHLNIGNLNLLAWFMLNKFFTCNFYYLDLFKDKNSQYDSKK